jgi:hypothetical protein
VASHARRSSCVLVAGLLLAASAITLALTYSGFFESSDDCDVYTDAISDRAKNQGWWIVAVVAYVLFVVVKSRSSVGNRQSYLIVLGVPAVLVLAWAIVVIAFPDITGIQWRPYAGLSMFLGPAVLGLAAYALFAVVKSRPLGDSGWSYLIGVPFAFMVGLAVLFATEVPFVGGEYC